MSGFVIYFFLYFFFCFAFCVMKAKKKKKIVANGFLILVLGKRNVYSILRAFLMTRLNLIFGLRVVFPSSVKFFFISILHICLMFVSYLILRALFWICGVRGVRLLTFKPKKNSLLRLA